MGHGFAEKRRWINNGQQGLAMHKPDIKGSKAGDLLNNPKRGAGNPITSLEVIVDRR